MSCTLNQKIHVLRVMRDVKQNTIASILGISQQDYSHLERNGKNISRKRLLQIAEILDVSVKFLKDFDSEEILEWLKLEYEINDHLLAKSATAIENGDEIAQLQKKQLDKKDELICKLQEQNRELKESIKDMLHFVGRKFKLQEGGGVKVINS